MTYDFKPSCINVLDEIKMERYNNFSPGFMCAGQKPHTFGNERHTICCGLTSIFWSAQIFKGMDRPAQLDPKLH